MQNSFAQTAVSICNHIVVHYRYGVRSCNGKIVFLFSRYLRMNGSKKSVFCVKMGNVKADNEVSYEFGRRKVDKKLQRKCPALMIGDVSHLPFQLQVDYTTPSGAQMKRVFTKAKKITTEREVAEKGV